MAFEENGGGVGMTMPVSPMYGGNGNGFGFGGDIAWIILLLLCGWGGGFGFGGMGGAMGWGMADGMMLYPWMNQAELTSNGFRDQMINNNITSVRDSISDISSQLCNGFAQAEIGANARQMADMNRSFALQSQFADCCCENRLASCQTQNIIQNEGNATRFADANNTRDIIQSQTNGTQAILDKLCALELDSKNDKIADLERQLTMANLSASQTAQTARILADNTAQTVALEQYLNPSPIPAYVVQNPNCCTQNSGCGCGSF